MYPTSTSQQHPTTNYRPLELNISYAYLNIPQSNSEVILDVLVTDHNQANSQQCSNIQLMHQVELLPQYYNVFCDGTELNLYSIPVLVLRMLNVFCPAKWHLAKTRCYEKLTLLKVSLLLNFRRFVLIPCLDSLQVSTLQM